MQEADFHEVSDEFINFANDLTDDWAPAFISAVILHAAARYNAHNYLVHDATPATEEAAINYYCDQYKRMLKESINELKEQV